MVLTIDIGRRLITSADEPQIIVRALPNGGEGANLISRTAPPCLRGAPLPNPVEELFIPSSIGE